MTDVAGRPGVNDWLQDHETQANAIALVTVIASNQEALADGAEFNDPRLLSENATLRQMCVGPVERAAASLVLLAECVYVLAICTAEPRGVSPLEVIAEIALSYETLEAR